MAFQTIIEPFRIHSVEEVALPDLDEREAALERAHYNLFGIHADQVTIDLLTDSGTGSMSSKQWAGMMIGDESYAGSRSFFRFKEAVEHLTGMPQVIPTHQGRAAEKILFTETLSPGDVIPNNTHFDTTRANVEYQRAEARDIVIQQGLDPESTHPFKGNMDVDKLSELLTDGSKPVPLVMLTVTNNSGVGQPVSMSNLKAVSDLCRKHETPLFLNACRFAENSWFIRTREEGGSPPPSTGVSSPTSNKPPDRGPRATQERLLSLRGRPRILITGSSAQPPRAVPKHIPRPVRPARPRAPETSRFDTTRDSLWGAWPTGSLVHISSVLDGDFPLAYPSSLLGMWRTASAVTRSRVTLEAKASTSSRSRRRRTGSIVSFSLAPIATPHGAFCSDA